MNAAEELRMPRQRRSSRGRSRRLNLYGIRCFVNMTVWDMMRGDIMRRDLIYILEASAGPAAS